MGIPSFVRELIIRYFGEVDAPRQLLLDLEFYSMSIDFNSIIHESAAYQFGYLQEREKKKRGRSITAAQVKEYNVIAQETNKKLSEEQRWENLFKTCLNALVEATSSYSPAHSLAILVDGPAPLAKVIQQRRRRYISAVKRNFHVPFDNACITPGTRFMNRFDNVMEEWLGNVGNELHNRGIFPDRIYYSGSGVSGEGEQKIADLYRQNELQRDRPSIVLGMDADLVLITLLSEAEQVYLMRQEYLPILGDSYGVYSYVLDIDKLRRRVKEVLVKPTALNDLLVLVTFYGNDFLPFVPGMGNFETFSFMLDIYKDLDLPITQGPYLHWPGILRFIQLLLDKHTDIILGELNGLKIKQQGDGINSPWVRSLLGILDLPRDQVIDTYRARYYNIVAPPEKNREKVDFSWDRLLNAMSKRYLGMFYWSYRYFKYGVTGASYLDYYPYETSPMLVDIYDVLNNELSREDINKNNIWFHRQPTYYLEDRIPQEVVPYLVLHSNSFPCLDKTYYLDMYQFLEDLYPLGMVMIPYTREKSLALLPPLQYATIYKQLYTLLVEQEITWYESQDRVFRRVSVTPYELSQLTKEVSLLQKLKNKQAKDRAEELRRNRVNVIYVAERSYAPRKAFTKASIHQESEVVEDLDYIKEEGEYARIKLRSLKL